MLVTFLANFIFRTLSGIQNGFGYARKDVFMNTVSIIMFIVTILTSYLFYLYGEIWGIPLSLLAGLGVLGVNQNFREKKLFGIKDIHLWEIVITTGYNLAWIFAGFNLLAIFCSTYPALILHKGFINIGANLPFFDERTDDPTGNTFGIPFLGITIPRATTKFRLIVAALSIVLFLINYFVFKINYGIYDIFELVKNLLFG